MTADQKLRDASTSVREARQHASFTVQAPDSTRRLSGAYIAVAAVAVVLLVVGLPLLILEASGQPDTDAATSQPAGPVTPIAVETTVAPPITAPVTDTPVVAIASQPVAVDITDLLYLASVVTGPPDFESDSVADYDLDGVWDGNPARPRPDTGSGDEAESFAFDVTYLIDDDLDSVWIDGGQRGVRAEFMFAFQSYVAISHVVIYPVSGEEQFPRYYRVQDYTISTDDLTADPRGVSALEVTGQLDNTAEPQRIDVANPTTTETFALKVTSTYPAETVGELPPTDDLAIAEIRIFGWTVDDPDLPRLWSEPTTTALITQSVNVDVFPKVGVCVNPDDGTVIPSRDSVVLDGPTRKTPREAFAAFLVEPGESVPSQSLSFSRSAYVEMTKPDGSIGFGYTGGFEYEDFDYYDDYDPEWGLATLITVTETADGWTVDSWGASGC